jgi:hypothetical protein
MERFSVLARALNGGCDLSRDEWRRSRRALVSLIKERTRQEDDEMLATNGKSIDIHRNAM